MATKKSMPHKIPTGKAVAKRSVSSKKAAWLRSDYTIRFFCADDIRIDGDGKPMLIGFYSDNVIVVNAPKDVKPTRESPLGLASLTFMFTISAPTGKHRAEISFELGGQLKGGVQVKEFEIAKQKTSYNVIAKAQPFPVLAFGKQPIHIEVDGHKFTEEIEIRPLHPD
ncbi:hypothetical protein GCM10027399_04580 [Curvibacter fontanus]|jgi:hypothetical protein